MQHLNNSTLIEICSENKWLLKGRLSVNADHKIQLYDPTASFVEFEIEAAISLIVASCYSDVLKTDLWQNKIFTSYFWNLIS